MKKSFLMMALTLLASPAQAYNPFSTPTTLTLIEISAPVAPALNQDTYFVDSTDHFLHWINHAGSNFTLVGANTTQTLTGKSMSGASNTFTLIPFSALPSCTSTQTVQSTGAALACTSHLSPQGGGTGIGPTAAGSIYFSNGTTFAVNAAKLFWDNADGFLGLGTTTPQVALDIHNGDTQTNGNSIFLNDGGGSGGGDVLMDGGDIIGDQYLNQESQGSPPPGPGGTDTTYYSDPSNFFHAMDSSGGNTIVNSSSFLDANTGLITSFVTNGIVGVGKTLRAMQVDNITAAASSFTCTVNPVLTLLDCGTSVGDCTAGTVTLGSVTVTALNTITVGTVSHAAIAAGHYWAWETTAGACSILSIVGTAEVR